MSERMITTQDLGTEEELILYQEAHGRLYVDDERVCAISALGDGIVALGTGTRTLHISATDYWRVLQGEGEPSPYYAGILAARLAHIERHAMALVEAIAHEAQISPTAYPRIWERIRALRIALGAATAAQMEPVREAP